MCHYPITIFSVLSVLENIQRKLSELGGNGFPFHDNTMAVKGICMRASVHWRFVDRPYRWRQHENRLEKDCPVIRVAPFSTINGIIRHISLVGKITGGKLISTSVKVSGEMDNLDAAFLAPSTVGTRILKVLENILELSIEMIPPVLARQTEESNKFFFKISHAFSGL